MFPPFITIMVLWQQRHYFLMHVFSFIYFESWKVYFKMLQIITHGIARALVKPIGKQVTLTLFLIYMELSYTLIY